MSATAAMIAQLRRMVDEADDSNGYDEPTLTALIEAYPLIDERGEVPYTWDTSSSPPSQDANEDWIATYDLHAAAAAVWEEKAGPKADLYMFSADGGQFVRSEIYKQYMGLARYHNARRAPRTIQAYAWPRQPASAIWIGNLKESD